MLIELVDQALDHRLCTVGLVVLPSLAQSGFDDVPIVVVESHIVLQHICCRLSRENIVDNKLAVAGEEVPPLVQLLNLLVVVNVLLLIINEYVILDKDVQHSPKGLVRLVLERLEQILPLVLSTVAKDNEEIADGNESLLLQSCSSRLKSHQVLADGHEAGKPSLQFRNESLSASPLDGSQAGVFVPEQSK